MKAVVVLALENSPIQVTLEEVDVSTDPALEARYGHEVPVLTIDGRKAAKYRVTESEITRMLESRAVDVGPQGDVGPGRGVGPRGGVGPGGGAGPAGGTGEA